MPTIREYRESRGWSQVKLAAEAGVGLSTVYAWENGSRMPTVPKLRRLAQVFGVRMDDFDLLEKPRTQPPGDAA